VGAVLAWTVRDRNGELLPSFIAASPREVARKVVRNRYDAIRSKLASALSMALDDAATRKKLTDLGAQIPDSAHRTPEALQKLVESEVARWAPVLKAQGAPAK
jgi:hypothetical protein